MSDSKNATYEPWLSICIPTYNRPLQLERMLSKLIPEINNGVEIIIRDDSERQETRIIAERILTNGNVNYKYFSGPRIGVDSASIFLLQKASGKYIWWFSDDDVIISGAIKKVKEIISTSEYATIWANFSYDKKGTLAVDRVSGQFESPDEALITLGTNVGLISTQIVRREIGLKAIDFAKKHIHGFSFASTAIFLRSLAEGPSYFFRGPAIECNLTEIDEIKKITTKNGEIVNDGFKVYGEYFRNLIVDLPAPYSCMAKRRSISINFASLWRGMIVGSIGGWDTPKGKRLKMLQLYWSYAECYPALLLLCLPRSIVTSFFAIYKIFYSHRKFIFVNKMRTLWSR